MTTTTKASPKGLKIWQVGLQSTFNISILLTLTNDQLMSPWISSASTTGWFYLKSQYRVLRISPKGWTAYHPVIRCQVRSSHRQFILTEDEPIQYPPEDSLSTKVEAITSSKVKKQAPRLQGEFKSPHP